MTRAQLLGQIPEARDVTGPRLLVEDAVETWLSFTDALGLGALRSLLGADAPTPLPEPVTRPAEERSRAA